MACACKVNQELDYLHKKYGTRVPVSKKTQISFRVKETIRSLGIWIAAIPIFPILFAHIAYKAIFTKDKAISVKKMLKIGKAN